jgi:hypothetical protein
VDFHHEGKISGQYRERDQKRGKSERTAHHICKNQLELVGPGRTAVERCGKITGIRNNNNNNNIAFCPKQVGVG